MTSNVQIEHSSSHKYFMDSKDLQYNMHMHILCKLYLIFLVDCPLRPSTHVSTQRRRITAIHSWIAFRPTNQCFVFSQPLGSTHCISSSGYWQLSPTNRNPHHTWSSSFLASRSYSPLGLTLFLWMRKQPPAALWSVLAVKESLQGWNPAWLVQTSQSPPPHPNSTSVCVIIKHGIFIPPVWES